MIRRLVMALVLFTLLIGGAVQTVYAYNPYSAVCGQSGASAASVCQSKSSGSPLTGSNGVIIKVTNLVAFVAGIAAVIILIVGAIRYITSGGDSGNIASAKNTVVFAIIGLVVIVLARTIVAFVVGKV